MVSSWFGVGFPSNPQVQFSRSGDANISQFDRQFSAFLGVPGGSGGLLG